MLVSLASILFLGIGVVMQAFFVPVGLPGMEPSRPSHSLDISSSILLIIGVLLALTSLGLWIICRYQQERAMQQQLKKLRIEAPTYSVLLRSKRAEASPHKREVWLILTVKVCAPLSIGIPYVIDLLIRLSHQPSYQQLQQLQMTTQPACLLLIPISILAYTILSTDFTKKIKGKDQKLS